MDIKEILLYLQSVDKDFIPNLSHKVDLSDFAKKIYSQAHYEYEESNDGKIKGLVVGYANDKEKQFSYISMVSVSQEFRNQGIARKLVNLFINYAESLEFIKIIGIHTNNPIALALYESIGFKVISVCDNRYYLEYYVDQATHE